MTHSKCKLTACKHYVNNSSLTALIPACGYAEDFESITCVTGGGGAGLQRLSSTVESFGKDLVETVSS